MLALVDNNPLAQMEAHPDKAGNAIDLGGQTAERWIAALREALDIIAGHMPELRAEIDVVLQQVVPVGYDEQRHLSASYQEAIGTMSHVVASAGDDDGGGDHPRVLAQQAGDPAGAGAAVAENAFWPLYPSPVRPDPRPLHGVLLAVRAFAGGATV